MALFSGVDGISEAMNLYHSTPEKNAVMENKNPVVLLGSTTWVVFPSAYDAFDVAYWGGGIKDFSDGVVWGRLESYGAVCSFKKEGDLFYWQINIEDWWGAEASLNNLLSQLTVVDNEYRYNSANINAFVSVFFASVSESAPTSYTTPSAITGQAVTYPTLQQHFSQYTNTIQGYYFNFP